MMSTGDGLHIFFKIRGPWLPVTGPQGPWQRFMVVRATRLQLAVLWFVLALGMDIMPSHGAGSLDQWISQPTSSPRQACQQSL